MMTTKISYVKNSLLFMSVSHSTDFYTVDEKLRILASLPSWSITTGRSLVFVYLDYKQNFFHL